MSNYVNKSINMKQLNKKNLNVERCILNNTYQYYSVARVKGLI